MWWRCMLTGRKDFGALAAFCELRTGDGPLRVLGTKLLGAVPLIAAVAAAVVAEGWCACATSCGDTAPVANRTNGTAVNTLFWCRSGCGGADLPGASMRSRLAMTSSTATWPRRIGDVLRTSQARARGFLPVASPPSDCMRKRVARRPKSSLQARRTRAASSALAMLDSYSAKEYSSSTALHNKPAVCV